MNAFIDSNGVLVSWGYAESNNDDTRVEVSDDFAMALGAAQYKDGAWSIYTAPVPSPALAAAAFAAGLTIASTGTPALNGTYGIDQLSQMDIIAIETSLNAGKGFPGGAATFNYADMSGAMHSFTEANFTNFAASIRDYVYALKSAISGAASTLPATSAVIA